MKKDKKENLFHFVFVDGKEHERRKQETIANLKEEQKTDFIFNGEHLYDIGGIFDFVYGYCRIFITKSGIEFTERHDNEFGTNDKLYKYENNEFIDITPEPVEYKPIKISNIKFPKINKFFPKLMSNDIISVQPMKSEDDYE